MRTYYLFISHSWTYSDAYDRLCDLLDNDPYFTYQDYSVPKDDPLHNAPTQQALKAAIMRRMQPCQVILVVAGVYATYSKWINIELDIAKRHFNKPVLGIKPFANRNISDQVRADADLIVNWNTKSIVSGIKQLVP